MPKKKPITPTPRVWVSMTMPKELVDRIDRLAVEQVRPRTQMIRKLLLRGLQSETEPAAHP